MEQVTTRCPLSRFVWLPLLSGILFVLIFTRSPKSNAQNPCPAPAYDSSIAPWAPGTQVRFSFDANGSQTSVATNPPPAFALNANMQASWSAGITGWNAHASQNGSNVTHQQGTTTGAFNHIITVAWPSANVTWTDSAGHSHTQQVTVSIPSAVAATFYIANHNSSNQAMSTAGAAITLINTNGTYAVDSLTYPMWDPAGANFDSALQKTAAHETGHGFGLGHPTGCGNVMSNRTASSQNPTGGTNDNGGCTTSTITTCDDQAVLNNPNNLYNPPPPPEGCNTPDGGICPCGAICDEFTGDCILDVWQLEDNRCSPIIIAVGADAAYKLTPPQAGVFFDIDGDGAREWMAWTAVGEETAFLVYDRNGNGTIDDGTELFGNHSILPTGQKAVNGFDALAFYDRSENGGNSDGTVDSQDAIWSSLRLWIDWNHNGLSEPGEIYAPEDYQLTGISLDYRTVLRSDGYGNLFRLMAPCQVRGRIRQGYDVFFSSRPQRRPN